MPYLSDVGSEGYSERPPHQFNMSNETNPAEDRIKILAKELGEHYDAVEILVSLHDGENGTRTLSRGAGNWHARYGLVKEYCLKVEEEIKREVQS